MQAFREWSQPGSNRRPPACKADQFVHSCLVVSRKCLQIRHFCWPREDTTGRRETNWCPPGGPSAFVTWGGGKRAAPAVPGCVSSRMRPRRQGRSRVGDRRLRVEPRHVLKLVHHVAIRAEGEPRVVAELASDVDHRAPLVEQQRRERVPEVVRTTVLQPRRLDRALERPSAPRLVRRKRPGRRRSLTGRSARSRTAGRFSAAIRGGRRRAAGGHAPSGERPSSCPSPRRAISRARRGSSARGRRATGAPAPHRA